MSKKPAPQPTAEPSTTQTPFERFKAAVSQVVTFPKSSLSKRRPKSSKK